MASCGVNLFRIKDPYFNYDIVLTVRPEFIEDSTNIKVMKISTNSDTLVLVTRNQSIPSVAALQILRLDLENRTSSKIAHITRSYPESLSYFVMATTNLWETSIIYATTPASGPYKDQVVLRKIDQHGTDTLFNNNLAPEIRIAGLRLYGSGNGRYIGLLWKSANSETKFEMHRVDNFNRIGLGPMIEPEFSFN